MPYIKQDRRDNLLDLVSVPENAGDLNYFITMACLGYVRYHGENYQRYNDVMGVLAGVQQELYRRRIAPYEDEKIKENGDVEF